MSNVPKLWNELMILLQVYNLLAGFVVWTNLKELGSPLLGVSNLVVLDVVNGEVLVGCGELLDVGSCLVLLASISSMSFW